jgi:hypothetical protein
MDRVLGDDLFYVVAVGGFSVHCAGPTICTAAFPWFVLHHPAGTVTCFICGAGGACIFGTWPDLPARDHGQERANTGDADLLMVDCFAQGANAFQVRFCIETVL